jgi:ribosomal protein S4
VGGKKVTIPSYMVAKDEENKIQYTIRSPLNELSHPARPKGEMYKTGEASMPMQAPVEDKPGAVVAPSQPQQTSALVTPQTQPEAVVEVPQQPAQPPAVPQQPAQPATAPESEKPKDEKPAKPATKPKEHVKKEKKTEEGA